MRSMLSDIQARGEEGALEWAKKLDGELDEDTGDEEANVSLKLLNLGFSGTALLTKEELEEQTKDVPCQVNFTICTHSYY